MCVYVVSLSLKCKVSFCYVHEKRMNYELGVCKREDVCMYCACV